MSNHDKSLDNVSVILTILDLELRSSLETASIQELKRRQELDVLGSLGDLLDKVFMVRYKEVCSNQTRESGIATIDTHEMIIVS